MHIVFIVDRYMFYSILQVLRLILLTQTHSNNHYSHCQTMFPESWQIHHSRVTPHVMTLAVDEPYLSTYDYSYVRNPIARGSVDASICTGNFSLKTPYLLIPGRTDAPVIIISQRCVYFERSPYITIIQRAHQMSRDHPVRLYPTSVILRSLFYSWRKVRAKSLSKHCNCGRFKRLAQHAPGVRINSVAIISHMIQCFVCTYTCQPVKNVTQRTYQEQGHEGSTNSPYYLCPPRNATLESSYTQPTTRAQIHEILRFSITLLYANSGDIFLYVFFRCASPARAI